MRMVFKDHNNHTMDTMDKLIDDDNDIDSGNSDNENDDNALSSSSWSPVCHIFLMMMNMVMTMNMVMMVNMVMTMNMVMMVINQDPSGCLCGTEKMTSSICQLVQMSV